MIKEINNGTLNITKKEEKFDVKLTFPSGDFIHGHSETLEQAITDLINNIVNTVCGDINEFIEEGDNIESQNHDFRNIYKFAEDLPDYYYKRMN